LLDRRGILTEAIAANAERNDFGREADISFVYQTSSECAGAESAKREFHLQCEFRYGAEKMKTPTRRIVKNVQV
jgi:hypothetical protein